MHGDVGGPIGLARETGGHAARPAIFGSVGDHQADGAAAEAGVEHSARDRLVDEGLVAPVTQCNAERLPFRSESFDCVTVAFGLRNMTRKEVALAEMQRVLRPGGRLLVLEFSRVAKPLAAPKSAAGALLSQAARVAASLYAGRGSTSLASQPPRALSTSLSACSKASRPPDPGPPCRQRVTLASDPDLRFVKYL